VALRRKGAEDKNIFATFSSHVEVEDFGHLSVRTGHIHPGVPLNVGLGFLLRVVCNFLIV
jgi:hypothetical protein